MAAMILPRYISLMDSRGIDVAPWTRRNSSDGVMTVAPPTPRLLRSRSSGIRG
jgi:hypothetical protein